VIVAKPKVGVVGGGVVGGAMQRLCGADTIVYDPKSPELAKNKEAVKNCDVVFVCVPTPMSADGSCDVSIVDEVCGWIDADLILIRSTVSPGTTDRLREKYNKSIVFQPEYLGETVAHVFGSMAEREFVVLGGTPEDISKATDFYKHYYNSYVRFYYGDAKTAEICKYMENAFYAMKVTFVNEFYDIARVHGVDYNQLRELWLADTRISRDHTFVYGENRGFSGKCLPKDCNAIVHSCRQLDYEPEFMAACLKINDKFQAMNERA
jgi:UDPglucose 6-dehydrogenase